MAQINRKPLGVCHHHKNGSSKPSYKEYSKYYGDKVWKKARAEYLTRHPLCEVCLKHSRIVPAAEIHHKIPWSRGVDDMHKMDLFLDESNFMAVCNKCHKLLHKKDQKEHQEVLDTLTQEEYELGHIFETLKL